MTVPPPRVLTYEVLGEPVPAQMGAMIRGRDGGWVNAKAGQGRVRAYKDKVRVFTMLACQKARWEASREAEFAVTLRAFVGTLRTIDCDNIAKAALDAIKGVAFPDDRQVVRLVVEKRLDRERPRVEVEIERLTS